MHNYNYVHLLTNKRNNGKEQSQINAKRDCMPFPVDRSCKVNIDQINTTWVAYLTHYC